MRISDWSSDVCSSDLALGRLVAPFLPARRLEGRVVGAVDLDGGERPAGEFQLALLRQPLGIEHAPPRLVGPAADADEDPALRHRSSPWCRRRGGNPPAPVRRLQRPRSEEHTSELQSLMRSSYAVFCLKKKKT